MRSQNCTVVPVSTPQTTEVPLLDPMSCYATTLRRPEGLAGRRGSAVTATSPSRPRRSRPDEQG